MQDISTDFMRRFILAYSETHKPGGVHCYWRTLRAFFHWLADEEILPEDWKNPMAKVKPPKVNLPPIEPIPLDDIRLLLDSCQRGTWAGDRDRAVFLLLLDTGMRAQELRDLDRDDVDMEAGIVTIRRGKGGKRLTAFIGKKTCANSWTVVPRSQSSPPSPRCTAFAALSPSTCCAMA